MRNDRFVPSVLIRIPSRRRPSRGTVLMVAIVCLLLVATVVALLARSGTARIQARRASVEREAALRRAESALELARLAVESGRLKPGGNVQAGGLTVSCASAENAIALTADAEAPLPPGVTSSSLRRILKVTWTLTAQGRQLNAWQTDYETLNTQVTPKTGKTDTGKK